MVKILELIFRSVQCDKSVNREGEGFQGDTKKIVYIYQLIGKIR